MFSEKEVALWLNKKNVAEKSYDFPRKWEIELIILRRVAERYNGSIDSYSFTRNGIALKMQHVS